MKLSEFKKQIKENIVDILSETPQSVALDAERKALLAKKKAIDSELANLGKTNQATLEEAELDEMSRPAGTVSIIDKAMANDVRTNFKGKTGKILDFLMNYEGEPLTKKLLAKELGYGDNNQQAINQIIDLLSKAKILAITGAAPAEPKEKEPKVKAFKPKMAALAKDDTPEDVIDTYYKADAEDVGFDDEKEPSKADISKNVGSKFASTGDKYKALIKQMKDVASKYKAASGDEAKMYVDQLKDLTKEKKKLEAILNPSMDDEDEEF